MTTFARQCLNALLPRGSAWAPKYDGGYDRLLNGVADCFQILRAAGHVLAQLRHPLTTGQLEDLEREFGVIGDNTAAEALQRVYLHGIVYGDIGTGSEDNLGLRLRAAGFDVRVHQNCPAIDPETLLTATPWCSCGHEDAVCGYEDAFCGGGGGVLLVNEVQIRAPIAYQIPDDPAFWSFVFWVGGEMTGFDFFDDWDMELQHTAFWTPGNGAILEKFTALKNTGLRSLKITAPPSTDVAQQQMWPDIITIDSDTKDFEIGSTGSPVPLSLVEGIYGNLSILVSVFQNAVQAATIQVVIDSACEDPGVGDWTPARAVLTKDETYPYDGMRCLRINADVGTSGAHSASQTVLTIGNTYLARGWMRGDGAQVPYIEHDGVALWTGTSSTEWQGYAVEFTATAADLLWCFDKDVATGAEYIEIDAVDAYDLTDGAPVDFVISYDVDGKIVFTADTDFDLVWTDVDLRSTLGFHADLAGSNTYTAAVVPPVVGAGICSFYRLSVGPLLQLANLGGNTVAPFDYVFPKATVDGPVNVITPFLCGILFDGVDDLGRLGQETAINGGFDADSDWGKGAGWSIALGIATHESGAESDLDQYLNITRTSKEVYFKITYKVNSISGGFVYPTIIEDDMGTWGGVAVNAAGTYTDTGHLLVMGTVVKFALTAEAATDCEIEFVSVEWIDPIFSSNDIAISAWVKLDSAPGPTVEGVLSNSIVGPGEQSLSFETPTSEYVFRCDVAGTLREVRGAGTYDRWTHVAAIRSYDGLADETNLYLYLDGVLADSMKAIAGAPVVTDWSEPTIGYHDMGGWLCGQLADNITIYYTPKDAAWVANEYARGVAALLSGPYAEQILDDDRVVTDARTLTVHQWGANHRSFPAPALIAVMDADGNWDPFAGFGDDADVNAVFTYAATNGVKGVRLYAKHTAVSSCLFDDVRFDEIVIARARVPAVLRDKFERMILGGKPVHSWAGLLVDYV